ncbi:MAG: ECF-type sigma factor [Mariniblastus sp.]
MAFEKRINLDELMSLVYDDLRQFASSALRNERPGHTLQTTALVHETYLRLAGIREIDWKDKDDVLRAAIGVMRRVLIDCARQKNALKRDVQHLQLTCPTGKFSDAIKPPDFDLLALDEALLRLRDVDPVKAEIVELRYFGGQKLEDVSRITELSLATVKRHWTFAKAWLFRELDA